MITNALDATDSAECSERNAATVGGLRAKLIMNEVNAKRSRCSNCCRMALASGDAEAARNIQMSLADLEATLRREGWGIDLAKFQAQLDQDAALAGLRRLAMATAGTGSGQISASNYQWMMPPPGVTPVVNEAALRQKYPGLFQGSISRRGKRRSTSRRNRSPTTMRGRPISRRRRTRQAA